MSGVGHLGNEIIFEVRRRFYRWVLSWGFVRNALSESFTNGYDEGKSDGYTQGRDSVFEVDGRTG